ncbi:IS3 family transposase [Nocardia asiatica]|uniref:IS3 family transposase n=1 Tax=Nocardia asiatica TaxID=209252 RepID=UPI003EDEFB32
MLAETIKAVHAASRGCYGVRRIHAELTGIEVGSGQVHSVMKSIGVRGLSGNRKRYISKQDIATHTDLVKRNFTAERENQLWCTDITEHPTPWIPVVVATLLEGGGVGWSEVFEGAAGVVLRSAGSWRQCQGRGDRVGSASWCGVYVAAEKWIGDAPRDSARLHRAGEGRVLPVAGRTRERLGCCA